MKMTVNILPKYLEPVINDTLFSTLESVEEKTITDFDPLLLGCVLYRLKEKSTDSIDIVRHWTILDLITFNQVKITDEDEQLAQTIRTHYLNKIMLTTLRGDRITNFRADLSKFLNNEYKTLEGRYQFPKKFLGMVHKLPYFYHYDLEIKKVFNGEYHPLKSNVLNFDAENKKLIFIDKVKAYRKGHAPYEYWFHDETGNRYMLPVEARNSLSVLFDYHLSSTPYISVKGEFRAARKDTLEYYRSPKWVLKF
jgi:hypothetical protein